MESRDCVYEAVELLDKLINDEQVDADTKTEAETIKQQLIDTLPYYEWLANLSDAIESGEIFEYFPIPEQKEIK